MKLADLVRAETILLDHTTRAPTRVPSTEDILRALEMAPEDVKIVILSQDPYPGKGDANGLAFAVNKGRPFPASLRNISKELENEYGEPLIDPTLENWQRQGVLLLNTALTTLEGQPGAHKAIWEPITQKVLRFLLRLDNPQAWLLWGRDAQMAVQKALADVGQPENKYFQFTSHPSPLGATKKAPVAFLGSDCFVNANNWLALRNIEPVRWFI